jgi:hypothetical protein
LQGPSTKRCFFLIVTARALNLDIFLFIMTLQGPST